MSDRFSVQFRNSDASKNKNMKQGEIISRKRILKRDSQHLKNHNYLLEVSKQTLSYLFK